MKIKRKNIEDPSPLKKRMCACGCGYEFQPTRSDQNYLNKNHYDYAYNHGPRKDRNGEENTTIKIIRKNDRILEKYYKHLIGNGGKLQFITLLAEGFDQGVFTRVIALATNKLEEKYHAMYKFCYRLVYVEGINYIIIKKI
jgi:hypothetical protein